MGVEPRSVRGWEEGLGFPYPTQIEKLSKWLNEDIPSPEIRLDEVTGPRIYNERLRRHMTTRDLADHLGVAARTVRDWERGALTPGLPSLKLLRGWLQEEDTVSLPPPHPLTEHLEGDFGSLLKKRRREWDMTQMELVKRLGIIKATLSSWENGGVPHITMMPRIAEWLDEEIPSHKIRIEEIRIEEISGDRIRDERLRLSMTRQELADHLGVHVTAVRHWEKGVRTPTASNLRRLQEWFEEDVPSYMVRIEEIGDQIRDERLRRGMTQQELADHFAIGVDTVHCWEDGLKTPQPHYLRRLREWFGESVPGYHTVGIEGVGDRLRNERLRRGMTQQELAEYFGIYHCNLSKWEQGLRTPRPHYLRRLREWFQEDIPSHTFRIEGVGDRMRNERLRRGMTQQELADHLGVSKATLFRWERGLATPGPTTSEDYENGLRRRGFALSDKRVSSHASRRGCPVCQGTANPFWTIPGQTVQRSPNGTYRNGVVRTGTGPAPDNVTYLFGRPTTVN